VSAFSTVQILVILDNYFTTVERFCAEGKRFEGSKVRKMLEEINSEIFMLVEQTANTASLNGEKYMARI
jgi:hypothetical protein